jgi:hypothetical protein
MEKSKMREALDMFEEAGFTVIGLSYHKSELLPEAPDYFEVSIRVREERPAIAGDIISLVERYNYRLIRFKDSPDNTVSLMISVLEVF